jgi:O-antigen/teichoic acid export membrane protein
MLAMNVTTSLVAAFSAKAWDHFIPSLREWRALVSFGAYMSGANFVHQVGARIPDLIIARILGYDALGLFNRANGVVGLFNDLIVSSISTVAFPAFAAARRTDEDIRGPYLRTVTLVTGALLPALALLTIVATPLVTFMLGDKWLGAAPLIPYAAVAAMFVALVPIINPFLSAIGWVRVVLFVAIWQQVTGVMFTGLFSYFGLLWLVKGSVLLAAFYLFLCMRALKKCVGIDALDLLLAVRPSVAVAVATVILPALILGFRAADHDPAWVSLVLGFGTAGGSWLAAIFGLRHPLSRELRGLFNELGRFVR